MAKKVRKRAPGGGRKPKPLAEKKAERVTIRIDTGTEQALQAALKAARVRNPKMTMSRVAELALKNALLKHDGMPQPRNRALGIGIIHLAESVERETGNSWRGDGFTAMVLSHAIAAFFNAFAPPKTEGGPQVPHRVSEKAERIAGGDIYRRPDTIGHLQAEHLVSDIRFTPRKPTSEDDFNRMFNEWSPTTWPMSSAAPDNIKMIADAFDRE